MHFPSSYVWRIGTPPSFVSRNGLIYCHDAAVILRDLPPDCVDMVLTDPPYGIRYRSSVPAIHCDETVLRQKEGSVLNDTPSRASHLFCVLVHEAERVLKPGGCMCCFAAGGGPNTMFTHWIQLMSRLMEFKQVAVWDKNRMGLGGHYRHSYEFVLVAKKRGAACKWRGGYTTSNVFRCNRPRYHLGQHPTPKPVDLMSRLISLHSDPGDLIVDPFCGQGPSLIAANESGRKFIGIEIDRLHVERASQLLEKRRDSPGALMSAEAGELAGTQSPQ